MARPSNAQKANAQNIAEQSRILLGEAIAELRNRIKSKDKDKKIASGSLIDLVGKLLPALTDDNTQTPMDVTMEMLAQKAVRVNLRIQKANRQSTTEEAIETPDSIEEEDAEPTDEAPAEPNGSTGND